MPDDPVIPARPHRPPRRTRRSGSSPRVLEHDGQQLSATQARRQALSDADHLAVLHAIWTAETAPARHQHYRDLLAAALPPGYHAEPGPKDQWLWRTLRAAEPGLTTVACVQAVQEKFGTRVHRRSLERALASKKKPRNPE